MTNIRLTALSAVVLFAACSKNDGGNPGSGRPSTYLTSFETADANGVTDQIDIHYSGSGTLGALILLTTDTGVTTYTTTLPIYGSNGKLSELLSAADSNATTGTVAAEFEYNGAGQLERVVYQPQSPGPGGAPYDSLAWNGAGQMTWDYHYTNFGPGDSLGLNTITQFVWNSQKDVTETILTVYSSPGVQAASILTNYTYDGFNNPYRTVKDLGLIMEQPSGVDLLTANNFTSARLQGYTTWDSVLYQYNSSGLPSGASLEVLNNGALQGQPLPVAFVYNP